MDTAICISHINDFLFCPKSLYLHSIYNPFSTSVYHDTPQVKGSITHENIENSKYTTAKHVLQGLSVYSVRLGLKGKIDIYNAKNKYLIERKYKVSKLYKGYVYQLYAQMHCLKEAGFPISKMFVHSLSDNKRYEVSLPTQKEQLEFEALIEQMRTFDSKALQNHTCSRCQTNIYSLLSW